MSSSNPSNIPPIEDIIDFARYPVHDLTSEAAQRVIATARADLKASGCASFPGFLLPSAVERGARETREASSDAFTADAYHNAYQLPTDPSYSDQHVSHHNRPYNSDNPDNPA